MLKVTFPRSFASTAAASVVATFVSLCITLLVALTFTHEIHVEGLQLTPVGTVMTSEEAERYERAAIARAKQVQAEFARNPLMALPHIKRTSRFVTWLPWVLVPAFVRIRRPHDWLVLLSLPAALLFTPLISVVEILLFAVAIAVGNVLVIAYRKRGVAHEEHPAGGGERGGLR
jgi:hypothetical protein